MADEMISLERLSDYNNNILRDANILKRKTAYVLNNVVNKGQVYLKCTQAGTTDIITLPLSNVQIGDILTDGTVKWEVISLNGAGAGSGNGLQDWKPQTEYHIDDNFVYENEIYKVRVKFTSGDNFENTQLMEEYTPIAWKDNHEYNVGDIFVENNVFYKVINAYTSGASFEVTPDIEVYTPIIFSNKESISIGDIVKYSTNYYIALQNFVCGDTFSLYAFEKYVPHELTEEEVNKVIQNFNPAFSGAFGFVLPDSAAAHNAVFRGQNITDYYNSGDMEKAIADGSFKNIFPGDYVVKSITVNGTTYDNVEWVIGDLDYHLHSGDIETTTHHVLLFPRTVIGTSYMNSSDTTTGGYVGSYMWTTRIPQYVTAIETTFGASHVLQHRELLSTATDTNRSRAYYGWIGVASGWAWTNVKVNLFNEYMIYGSNAVDSSFFDCGDGNTQISVMRHYKPIIHTRSNWYWLRSVSVSAFFACCDSYGISYTYNASAVGGVRPYFLFH